MLQLVSSGGGNIPTAPFLDDRVFLTSVIVADYFDPAGPLPPHQLIFNAIGDADLCQPALQAAARLVERTSAPVINDPRAVMKTGRIGNAEQLRAIPGVVTPRTAGDGPPHAGRSGRRRFDRERGVWISAAAAFARLSHRAQLHPCRNGRRVSAAAAGLPGDDLLVIEYLDARGQDGKARKYRVMMIDGTIYPSHLAISKNWKVHYFTSDMADHGEYRREEANFLGDMPATLGSKAMAALERIRDCLGLDYAGVDFAVGPDGDLLLFEANATMVIAPPAADERWTYRRAAIDRIRDAVVAMIMAEIADQPG